MGETDSISNGVPRRWIDKALMLLWFILSAAAIFVWSAARASEIKNIQQDEKIETIQKRFDKVDDRFDRQDAKLDRIYDKVK